MVGCAQNAQPGPAATALGTTASSPLRASGGVPAPTVQGAPSGPESVARAAADPALARRVAFLQRLSFGVNGTLLNAAEQAGGETKWLDGQLHPDKEDGLPAEVSARLHEYLVYQQPLEPLVLGIERQRKAARVLPKDSDRKQTMDSLRETSARLGREAQLEILWRETYSTHQLQELMTAFWLNHFSVFIGKGDVQLVVADFANRAVRPHVFGRFQDLLRAAAHHPAMLRYLDNERNAAGHVNENFARELMELHTLGVDGGYSQKDVQEMARALTGFGVWVGADPPKGGKPGTDSWRREGLFEYLPGRHDFGEKVVLGERLHARGWGEFDEVLQRLANHPATIRHISAQYATFLLGHAPGDALLDKMGQTWRASDGDLRKLLLAVVQSDEFNASLGQGFKSPQRYVASALRLAYEDRVVLNLQPALNWLNRMQEAPFAHTTPEGYPLLSAGWTASGQFATRFEIARQLGFGSAGLFRPEGSKGDELPAFPQLATPFYYRALEPQLSPATRQALTQAKSPQEWTLLLLASPEMMRY